MSGKKYLNLTVAVTINFCLQFFFQWYLIKANGAGEATDALFGAMALPQFILLVLSGSLTMVLIPVFSKYEGIEFLSESWNYLQFVAIVFFLIGILLFLTSKIWVHWILPGFTGKSYLLAVKLSDIQIISMFLSALLSVLWAIHSSKNNFFLIETTSIAANIVSIIILIYATKIYGIYAAAWAFVVRALFQILFLCRILGKYIKPNFYSISFKDVSKKLKPLIIGNTYYKTDLLVDRYLISGSATGTLTIFNLAQQLYSIGSSVYAKVFINTLVPNISRYSNKSDWNSFNRIFTKRLVSTLIFSVFCFIIIFIFGKYLFELIFSSKNFSLTNIKILWIMMIGLSGYWIGGLLGNLTSNTFYAKGDTKTPTVIGAILFSIYIPVKIFSFIRYGMYGLVITISIYYLISLLIQLIFLRKHISLKHIYGNNG